MNRQSICCSCGERLVVNEAQAGTTVECRCGACIAIPNLREFAESQPSAGHSGAERFVPIWGRRQAYMFIGSTLVSAGLACGAWIWLNKPTLPDVADLSPVEAWILWQQLRQGPERHLSPPEQAFEDQLSQYRQKLGVMSLVTAFGLILTMRGLLIPHLWRHAEATD